MIKVWSILIRALHWSLVISVVAAWLTREGFADDRHIWLGYACIGIIVARIGWGFFGARRDRFTSFVAPPAVTAAYACQIIQHAEPRYLGHNPLGGWMIVALLVTLTVVCFSGWLYTTDTYWGIDWVIQVHDISTTALLCLVALHVGGVIFTSIRHKENLLAAMLHGCKRDADADDIPPP